MNSFSAIPVQDTLSSPKHPEIDRNHPLLNQLQMLGHPYDMCVEAIIHCGYDQEAAEDYIEKLSKSTTKEQELSQSPGLR